jgi:hypothetical protein
MNVTIGGKMFPGEYLTNPEDIQRGMMGRDSLEGCMVFKMGKGHHSFWMKNCLIPLDIVFVLNNRVSRIHHNWISIVNLLFNLFKYPKIGMILSCVFLFIPSGTKTINSHFCR